MKKCLLWMGAMIFFGCQSGEESVNIPYNAQGDLAGEIGYDSAIINVRLTEKAKRNPTTRYYTWEDGHVYVPYRKDMSENVPGAAGWARVLYGFDSTLNTVQKTGWKKAVKEHDFNVQFALTGLPPDTVIWYRSEIAADSAAGETRLGRVQAFQTAPEPQTYTPFDFTIITCWAARSRDIWRDGKPWGFQMVLSMQELDPAFTIHTGDIVYYDSDSPCATDLDMMRYHWRRMFSIPCVSDYFRWRGIYAIKDDHDYRWDDAWPQQKVPHYHRNAEYMITDEMGRQVFLDAMPMGDKTYRRVRWGKAVEMFLVEGRDYRSPNTMPDGPDKTIWGDEQKAWLKKGLKESDAIFKILVSPTPLVGPDRQNKTDNHADLNGFYYEGREFLQWVKDQNIKNFMIAHGDRHWQYHSIDRTGAHEFSCGACADVHAAKNQPHWDEERQPYFRDEKGGFLHVAVRGTEDEPELRMIHRDVDGTPVYVKRFAPMEVERL
jgi:phosphodiesterase/alkaline phosphatase D-like protein